MGWSTGPRTGRGCPLPHSRPKEKASHDANALRLYSGRKKTAELRVVAVRPPGVRATKPGKRFLRLRLYLCPFLWALSMGKYTPIAYSGQKRFHIGFFFWCGPRVVWRRKVTRGAVVALLLVMK